MNTVFACFAAAINASAMIALLIALNASKKRLDFQIRENRNLQKVLDDTVKTSIHMQRILNGNREPGQHCIGCKHLFIYRGIIDPITCKPQDQYNCRKTIRCSEFEEANTDVH